MIRKSSPSRNEQQQQHSGGHVESQPEDAKTYWRHVKAHADAERLHSLPEEEVKSMHHHNYRFTAAGKADFFHSAMVYGMPRSLRIFHKHGK